MGKDKPTKATPESKPLAAEEKGKPIARGHKQRGAGTIITAKAPVVTEDGIVLKAHERLPFQLLQEYCQREKRPNPVYEPSPPGCRFKVTLPDAKNSKNDLSFCPSQTFESPKVAKDYAALLALWHFQKSLPLERKLPEPYCSTWMQMIAASRTETAAPSSAAGASAKVKPGSAPTSASAATTSSAAVAIAAPPTLNAPEIAVASEDSDIVQLDHTSYTAPDKTTSRKQSVQLPSELDRSSADWLCDNCGVQNFATLASGARRIKCFKCQTPKSDTVTLVAGGGKASATPSTSLPANAGVAGGRTGSNKLVPTGSVAGTSGKQAAGGSSTANLVAIKAPPVAVLDLRNRQEFVSRAEEEKLQLEKLKEKRRKNSFFTAWKLANRYCKVFLSARMKREIESVLNIVNSGATDVARRNLNLSLSEVISHVATNGFFSKDAPAGSLDILSPSQQAAVINQHVVPKLKEQGFNINSITEAINALLASSNSSFIEEVVSGWDAIDSSVQLNATLEATNILTTAIIEACLEYLCLNLVEEELPEGLDGKESERTRQFDVYVPPSRSRGRQIKEGIVPGASNILVPSIESAAVLDNPEDSSLVQSILHYGWSSDMIINAINLTRKLLEGPASINRVKLQSMFLLLFGTLGLDGAQTCEHLYSQFEFNSLICGSSGICAGKSHSEYEELSNQLNDELDSLRAIFSESEIVRETIADTDFECVTVSLNVQNDCLQHELDSSFNSIIIEFYFRAGTSFSYPDKPPLCFVVGSTSDWSPSDCNSILSMYLSVVNCGSEHAGELMLYTLCLQAKDQYISHLLSNRVKRGDLDLSQRSRNVKDLQKSMVGLCLHILNDHDLVSRLNDLLLIGDCDDPSSNEDSNTTVVRTDVPVDEDVDESISEATQSTAEIMSVVSQSTNSSSRVTSRRSFWYPEDRAFDKTRTSAGFTGRKISAKTMNSRRELPAWSCKDNLIALLRSNNAIVVTGETGCGKTTQVPQFIHEEWPTAKIVICQPRRLAAVGVAARVAEERECALGEDVGFMVRGESRATASTRLVFCTYGVLLRRLQDDPDLLAINFIVLDEVHERGLDSDFALSLLIAAAKRRKEASGPRSKVTPLCIILMSATISTEKFALYLGQLEDNSRSACIGSVGTTMNPTSSPVLHIPGFTYPVELFYRNQFEFIIREQQFACLRAQSSLDNGDSSRFDDDTDDYRGRFNFTNVEEWIEYKRSRKRKGEIDFDLLAHLVIRLCSGSSALSRLIPSRRDDEEAVERDSTATEMLNPMSSGGCVLLFMPGVPEINRFISTMNSEYDSVIKLVSSRGASRSDMPKLSLFPLHGGLSPSEQKMVFQPARRNEIKVVVATNVAEASVTISDVVVVIDTCRVKELEFDIERQVPALVSKLASQDSLRQRCGRAGRVSAGRCFRMITQNSFSKLSQHTLPEMLRSPLDQLILQLKATTGALSSFHLGSHRRDVGDDQSTSFTDSSASTLTTGISYKDYTAANQSSTLNHLQASSCWAVLDNCPDPPQAVAITTAIARLVKLQALDKDENLTALGHHLSDLPCDARTGRLLVYGVMLGCVYDASCVAASISVKSPFLSSSDAAGRARIDDMKAKLAAMVGGARSDQLVIVQAHKMFHDCVGAAHQRRFCNEHGLSFERMMDILKEQRDLLRSLVSVDLLSSVEDGMNPGHQIFNRHSGKVRVVMAAIVAGTYPQLAKIIKPPTRYVETIGGALEKDADARELKFYIPKPASTEELVNSPSSETGTTLGDARVAKTEDDTISTEGLDRVFVHPTSVNFNNNSYKPSPFVLYGEIQQTVSATGAAAKVCIRECSEVFVYSLLLFGGELQTNYSNGTISIDGWMRFSASGRIVALIQGLRRGLDDLLLQKIRQPTLDISTSSCLKVAIKLLLTEGM